MDNGSTGGVVAYPAPAGATPSGIYSVEVNGTPIFVERFEDLHYAHFAFDGQCDVTVSVKPSIGHRNLKYIHAFQISPRRYHIPAASDLNRLTFSLSRPRKLVITVNEYERLILFADALETGAPTPGSPGVVDAMKFVTDNAGSSAQTDAIRAAVEAVPAGGVLYFPPGVYLTGTVTLKSDMTLYLAGGAVLKSSLDRADYPAYSGSSHWLQHQFLHVAGARNVRIAGHGTIDGSGTVLRAGQFGPHLVVIRDSSDVVMDGVFVRDPAAWNTHLINSDGVTLRNIKMLNNRDVLNTDGFDITSSRRVLVEDCFAYTSDDAVVVKTHGGLPSRDVTARANVILAKKSALKVGTETHGDVTDIFFLDNEVVECDRGMSLYVEDGALVSNVQYVNNRFERPYPDARRRLLDFYIWNRSNGGGNLADVLVKDCEADVKWPRPSTIIGLDAQNAIRGVRFENFRIEGRVAASVEEADILVEVNPPSDVRRPAVYDISFDPDNGRPWNPGLVNFLQR